MSEADFIMSRVIGPIKGNFGSRRPRKGIPAGEPLLTTKTLRQALLKVQKELSDPINMMNILKFSTALLTFSLVAFGDTVYVQRPEGTPPEINPDTLVNLLQHSARAQGYTVAAKAEGADFQIHLQVLKLGGSYVIMAEKLAGGKVVHSTRLKAREVEEFDEVANRVIRALAADIDAARDARPTDVTIDETMQGVRRKESRKGFVGGFQLPFLSHLGVMDAGFGFYLGQGWSAGPIGVGYRWDLGVDWVHALAVRHEETKTAWFSDLVFNLTWYLIDRDFSPFVAFDAGYGLARHAELQSSSGGLLLGLDAGIGVLRTYTHHVQLGVRFMALLQSSFAQTPLMTSMTIGTSF